MECNAINSRESVASALTKRACFLTRKELSGSKVDSRISMSACQKPRHGFCRILSPCFELGSNGRTLVQPPLNTALAAIAFTVCDGAKEGIGAVNGTIDTTHALVADGGLDGGARGGVVQGNRATAIWVPIRLASHEANWKSDLHLAVGVDVPAACAKT